MDFIDADHSLETYWRSIILFGKNVASYKFALAKSLLEVAPTGRTFITLEELAEPFSRHITEHLLSCDKQITSSSSQFLDKCRAFNAGKFSKEELIDITVKRGFNNVIDAFHNVNNSEIPTRFFTDERQGKIKGISLTDNLLELPERYQNHNLPYEIEARWKLVETAWLLRISRNLITVKYDINSEILFIDYQGRVDITSCREALNGYQKGKCFYCFTDISIESKSSSLADVDHFFPRKLLPYKIAEPIDGVWNLVLSCQKCNRGERGKFDRLPHRSLLRRLYKRNEFFIISHHPLRETLMAQTGVSTGERLNFLKTNYQEAESGPLINSYWKPEFTYPPAF